MMEDLSGERGSHSRRRLYFLHLALPAQFFKNIYWAPCTQHTALHGCTVMGIYKYIPL